MSVNPMMLDKSVSDPADDRYGFHYVAQQLALAIQGIGREGSAVIGIEGGWGSGKTSLLNLLRTELEKSHEENTFVLTVSPWLDGGGNSPVESLLIPVAEIIAKEEEKRLSPAQRQRLEKKKELTKTAETVLHYSRVTARHLAPVAEFASLIPGLPNASGALKSLSKTKQSGKGKTTAELRTEIAEKIAALDLSFIVLLDDLDRLEPVQAVEVIRLVKSVADFPRFRYLLCYDKAILAQAISHGLSIADGELYMQKIVQISVRIPRPESFALRRELREGAQKIWREVNDGEPDSEMWSLLSHYIEVYGEALTTPREVKQVMNAIRFRYPGLRDYVFYPDLCLLQLISAVNPGLIEWVEYYLTEWAVHENCDTHITEEKRQALAENLEKTLSTFGVSRARSVWELTEWLPGISGFDSENTHLFEKVPRADAEQARILRRLSSSIYWRYYFSFSAPQNVMSDADFLALLRLADSDYIGLEKRLLDSVTTNGVSSRTWFEHILTRLTPVVMKQAGYGVQHNLLKFFFRCSDRILPFYYHRDIFFRQEEIGIDAVVTQLCQQLMATNRITGMDFISRCFRQAEAFVWAAVYLRHLPSETSSDRDTDVVFTSEDIEQLRQAMRKRLANREVQKRLPDIPYLASFLYAWQELTSTEVIREWASGTTLNDKEFLQMLLNLRTAVSSSNLGLYLRLSLDKLSEAFGFTNMQERLDEIKAKRVPDLSEMLHEVEEAIRLNGNTA